MTANAARHRLAAPVIAAAASARIVIAGGPHTGKTTLAAKLHAQPISTDDLAHLEWSQASEEAAKQFDLPGPWVCEGVATVRALRKWMRANPGKPCDVVIWLETPRAPLEKQGQRSMAKGCATVWAEVEPDLIARGVRIQHGEPNIVGAAEIEVAP